MLGLSCQQIERVRQQVQYGVEAAFCAGRAPGKIDDEGAACDSGDGAAESCVGCLFEPMEADLLGDARDEPVTDGERGLGSDISLCHARTAGGQDEVGALCGFTECRNEVLEVIGDYLRINDLRTVFAKQTDE